MEKKFFTLLFILFISAFSMQMVAQDAGGESYITRKDAETAYLKNTTITIDDKVFDYRILKHYTETELRSLPLVKRNQVHFIYTESFTVSDLSNCASIKITDIDVAKLERFRKENESAIVEYGDACKIHVELISSALLKQKMEELNK